MTTPQPIILREYETLSTVHLTPTELSAIQTLAGHGIELAPSDQPGCYDLTASSVVGALNIGSRSVIVQPKLPISRVLFLLSYSVGITRWPGGESTLDNAPDLFEAFALLFAREVARATQLGLLRGYVPVEDQLLTVRGRIRLMDQVRSRPGRWLPLEVAYDEFTEDVAENRILKTALARLLRMRIRLPRLRQQLASIHSLFGAVGTIQHMPRVTFTRLNQHYRHAIALAKLVLQLSAVDVRTGTVQVESFMVDMNRVFEDFVVRALRDALRVGEHALPQNARGRQMWLDVEEQVKLEPDISLWEGSHCVFVGDVKYKAIGVSLPPNTDVYQMISYALAAGLQYGLIIYAEGAARELVLCHHGIRVRVASVPLSLSPPAILRAVSDIAHEINHVWKRAAPSAVE